jgi:hypothetical protein
METGRQDQLVVLADGALRVPDDLDHAQPAEGPSPRAVKFKHMSLEIRVNEQTVRRYYMVIYYICHRTRR